MGKPTVLIVDDDKDLREMFPLFLGKDFEVYTATNGREGLEAYIRESPDLLITDHLMPELLGADLAVAVRAYQFGKSNPPKVTGNFIGLAYLLNEDPLTEENIDLACSKAKEITSLDATVCSGYITPEHDKPIIVMTETPQLLQDRDLNLRCMGVEILIKPLTKEELSTAAKQQISKYKAGLE